jgi:hypothetical protein
MHKLPENHKFGFLNVGSRIPLASMRVRKRENQNNVNGFSQIVVIKEFFYEKKSCNGPNHGYSPHRFCLSPGN